MNDTKCSSSSPNIILNCLPAKKNLWMAGPSSFHQSFDDRLQLPNDISISNSCGNINQKIFRNCPNSNPRRRLAFCSGDSSQKPQSFVPSFYINSGASSLGATCKGCSVSGGSMTRLPHLDVRSPQSSFESNGDVGQISLNWMRMNGAIAPFKILNSDYGNANCINTTPIVPAPLFSSTKMGSALDKKDGCSGNTFSGLAGLEGSCHRIATMTAATAASPNILEFVRQKDSSAGILQSSQNYNNNNNNNNSNSNNSSISTSTPTTGLQILSNSSEKKLNVNNNKNRPLVSALNMTVTIEGEHGSKKSLSLVSASDLEMQKIHDNSRAPLMSDQQKGGRLIKRQFLFHDRRVTSDFAFVFSIMGIALMVVENELSAAHYYEKNSMLRLTLKLLIFVSTLILIALVVKFHVHEVQLFMNANSVADWWIAMTPQQCMQLSIEILACGICPLPIDFTFNWTTVYDDGRTAVITRVPVDVLLSIPMFFRLYWVWRVMLLHSRLFTDNCNRSIAGLNRVNLNSRFILKILMTLCPGTMLMVFTASLWIIAGWILRLCERHYDGDPINIQSQKHQNYLNSLWLIAITFLSVGYGDIVPNTYCGRVMAVVAGILGTGTSSMVVAVIARKLELTRAEKHVHNFMMDTQLTKQLKHCAANVLRETWLIYKYRRLVEKVDKDKVRHHQRKFLVAIYALRKVKRDQRKLNENSVSLGDVAKTTSNAYELVRDIYSSQEGLALRVVSVEHQLSDIQRELSDLTSLLRASLRIADENLSGGMQRNFNNSKNSTRLADSLRRRHKFNSTKSNNSTGYTVMPSELS